MIIKLGALICEYSVRNKLCEDIPVYSVTNDKGFCTGYFSKEVASKDKSTYKIVPRGYFAYNPSRINVGSIDWQNCESRVIVSPLYIVFSISDKLKQQYLLHYLKSDIALTYIKTYAIGSVRDNLKLSMLKEFPINLRSIEEQQKIADVLDEVGDLIALRKKQLEKLNELVKSRFVEMFGDPLLNPFAWSVIPLADIIVTANNGLARRGNDTKGNIVLRLVELQNGYIDYSAPNRIILSETEKQHYRLVNNDFLFARVNGNPTNVGRCAVFSDINEPVYHNDHIIRVHFNENYLNGCFASVLLNSNYGKNQMKGQIKTSAGQYTISQDGIGKIVSILPPIELQEEFATFVQQVDKQKSSIQQSLDKLEVLKKALMQEYFG